MDAMGVVDPTSLVGFEYGDIIERPFPTVTAAFYHYARAFPGAIAVRDLSHDYREVTYAELAQHAQSLASQLQAIGVKPHQKVPLVVKRGLEMVVGIWAILSCGAQYVPLDGGVVPNSTIQHVAEQADGVVLCLRSTHNRIKELCPNVISLVIEDSLIRDHELEEDATQHYVDLATPDGGCYVIYTSGTTGKPKGVDVTQANVSNLVCLSPGSLDVQPGTCVGSVLNISFDMAAWEIFACLCNGGTLVLRGPEWEPVLRQIDVLICTPTILSKYSPLEYPRIRTVATAGEPSSQSLADQWATKGRYYNCCGPTETTIVNTMSRHVTGQTLSIGVPTPNNSIYILDEQGSVVTSGSIGFIWAGGLGVSRGYVGLDEKTREVYVPDTFAKDGSKMYRTGDLGSWREDGQIEIHGRVDDQVKVKGFRIELDGVSATIASAAGISRATTLLIDGELHGFVCPAHNDLEEILAHMRKHQPYYAVPKKIHCLDQFPATANGKIDKKALALIASAPIVLGRKSSSISNFSSDSSTISIEKTLSISSHNSTSLHYMSEKEVMTLTQEIPEKRWGRPFRGLRLRVLIVYRILFSLMSLLNIGVLIAVVLTNANKEWLATITAINLVIAVVIRQDHVINMLYAVACSVPKSSPLALRKRMAKIYHLGGIHSGAAVCATAWLVASTVKSTVDRVTTVRVAGRRRDESLATLVTSWILSALCCGMVICAMPAFRKKYHNIFERVHRFAGWTVLALFWVRTGLSVRDSTPYGDDLGLALIKSPGFWLLGVATCSIASSWMYLRKTPVHAERLSDHAVMLSFEYDVPVNGSFARLACRPMSQWHSFATIPNPKDAPNQLGAGYSVVVSNAGDWTRECIRNPPKEIWVRGVPTSGVMRVASLFNRLVIIATGSGIGPMLGHISHPSCPTQLIWSAPDPEKTFGKDLLDTIHAGIPDALIYDTKQLGRPDLVRMGYNLAMEFKAEAVIIIANEKITKKVVYGLESRGLPAFGAIWDS